MPETYNLNDVIEVQVIGRSYDHECMNRLFFRVRIATMTSLTIATELNSNWVSFIRGITANSYRWTRYQIRRVIPGEPTSYESALASQDTGFASSSNMPNQVCNLWALKTGFEPGKRPGRLYLGGIPGGVWSNNAWVNTFISGNTNAITAMLNRYGPAGAGPLQWMLVSFDGEDFTDARGITSIFHRERPATQRRRRANI